MTSPSAMNYPKVFIIILNWNGLKDTLECLESVLKLDYPNFKVIVVDNGSTDDPVEVLRKTYPQITLIENNENLGYTGGNNIAMRHAMEHGADYMWLLNNDTVVETDTLSKIVATTESSSEIGLVSPVIYYYDDPSKVQFCGSYIDWNSLTVVYPEHKSSDVDSVFTSGNNVCLWGTALLIRRALIEKVGYLKDDYFAYWEDTEYSVRVLKAGFKNRVCSSGRIYHKAQVPQQGQFKPSKHYTYYMLRNGYFFHLQCIKGLKRLSFMRRHLSDLVIEIGYNQRANNHEMVHICFSAAWDAFHGISGKMQPERKNYPMWLKKALATMLSWHPSMWAGLIRGDVKSLFNDYRKYSSRSRAAT